MQLHIHMYLHNLHKRVSNVNISKIRDVFKISKLHTLQTINQLNPTSNIYKTKANTNS